MILLSNIVFLSCVCASLVVFSPPPSFSRLKMKFLSSLFLTLGAVSAQLPIYGNLNKGSQKIDNIPVGSALGSKIMANARQLENAGEIDFTWVADFSIKFQGCHHVSQWNDNAEGEEDVRIQTKRLIRFRLCPSDSCSTSSSSGCTSAYGDYIIDMNTFLNSYYEAVEDYNQYRCEYISQFSCDCNDDDAKGDDFNREVCEYECFVKYDMVETCDARNPYNDDQAQEEEKFELRDYVECAQVEFQQDEQDQQQRLLEQEEQIQYFIGPYCAEQGGAIYLGLFTDDTCSTFADSNGGYKTYGSLAGANLPYARESIIGMDCLSCKEPEDFNYDGNDAQDADQVIQMCEEIYELAGKCESALEATGYISEANENACNYIAGIKVVRKDGIITQVGSKANKTASIFIGIFVVAFVLLAAYVYYLKTKLDRASINLSD